MFPCRLPAFLIYAIDDAVGCSEVNRISDEQGARFDRGSRMAGIGSRINQSWRCPGFPSDLECLTVECDHAISLRPENNQFIRDQRGRIDLDIEW